MTTGLGGRLRISILTLTCLLAGPAAAQAPENNGQFPRRASTAATDRIIVKWRNSGASARAKTQTSAQASPDRARKLGTAAGVRLKPMQKLGADLEVLQIDTPLDAESFQDVLTRLRADAAVEFAEPDRRRYPHALPNDPFFYPGNSVNGQWYLRSDTNTPSAIDATSAWDITQSNANVVIAILDTGVLFDHPDLQRVANGGRLLPGYDFVSADPGTPNSFLIANDGDGRDADAADPGDWINSTDQQNPRFADCDSSPSSWHGTRVAGIVGARTNNVQGVAGVTWNSLLLPVRVLGKCGGFDSDILAAMRWAAGIPVVGVPDNLNPAKVINLSLGSVGSCSQSYRNVIAELSARGVLVVASAGNEVAQAVDSPANCPDVLAVAGLRHIGTKVGYSNMGAEIGIAAPAGNCVATGPGQLCQYSIDTTVNSGLTTPNVNGHTHTNSLNYNVGTSFSAPIAAAAAALVRSANTILTPAQVIVRLKQSATPFPAASGATPVCPSSDPQSGECSCTTSTCGAGMLNAAAAVTAAQRPFVIVTANPTSPATGQTVNLDGAASFAADGRTIQAYAWTVVSTGGTSPTITNANMAAASFIAPAAGSITLRLTITDDQGAQDSADILIATPAASPPARGGGGGGTLGLELLAILLSLLGSSWKCVSRR